MNVNKQVYDATKTCLLTKSDNLKTKYIIISQVDDRPILREQVKTMLNKIFINRKNNSEAKIRSFTEKRRFTLLLSSWLRKIMK